MGENTDAEFLSSLEPRKPSEKNISGCCFTEWMIELKARDNIGDETGDDGRPSAAGGKTAFQGNSVDVVSMEFRNIDVDSTHLKLIFSDDGRRLRTRQEQATEERYNNKGAYIVLEPPHFDTLVFHSFEAVTPRPEANPFYDYKDVIDSDEELDLESTDAVVFAAEVVILEQASVIQYFIDQDMESSSAISQVDTFRKKEVICIEGVYECFATICIYLESDESVVTDPDNFWVKYGMAVVNQKNHAKSEWKESSIRTRTWNNSVLQFMKVSDMLEADAEQGFTSYMGRIPHCHVTLREKLLMDAGAIAGFLTGLRVYLDDPAKDRLDPGTDEGTNASTVQKSASLRTKPQTKCPERSEELLGLIVNSLRALDGAIPQGCPEARRMPQSAQKIAHTHRGSNDEPLAATIDFIFKAALQCQHLPEAVRSIRVRLKDLGFEVFPCSLLSTRHTDGIVEGLEEDIEQTGGEGDDFTYVLALAETLALSGYSHVTDFAKMLYTILLR
ncbi:hypothetical protein Vadar_034275 [Vaccinium darrowii]|uniref:Uncharacterized protein n=1 Tax=Vaccinium darrowii TaxID=229202 RepID=A0ACB7XLS4_9ERIC|nr:hypothetical protein Vadar_034275 [Vaccinium darrowii]